MNCHSTFSESPLQKAGAGLCARFQGRAVEAADVPLVPRRCRRTEQPGEIRAQVQKSFTAKGGPTVPTAATVPPPAYRGACSFLPGTVHWLLAPGCPPGLSPVGQGGGVSTGEPRRVSAALVNSSAQAREPRPEGLRNLGDPEPSPTRLGPPRGRPGLRDRVGSLPLPPHTHTYTSGKCSHVVGIELPAGRAPPWRPAAPHPLGPAWAVCKALWAEPLPWPQVTLAQTQPSPERDPAVSGSVTLPPCRSLPAEVSCALLRELPSKGPRGSGEELEMWGLKHV